MTSYTLKTMLFYMLLISALSLQAQAGVASAVSGPEDEVFEAWMYLWNQAPSRFSELLTEEDWKKAEAGYYMTSIGYERFKSVYDIPGFEKESARLSEYGDRPPHYVINAKREFDTDEECLAWYHALLEGFTQLLASDDVKISKHDDHVFFKDRQDAFYRRLYVKRYLNADRGKRPRVRVSVRVEFPE